MISAQALAVCIFTAAQTYAVPPSVLLGILSVEGGRPGLAVRNTNDTYDLGPMQINTIWIPQLARHWRVSKAEAKRLVRDEPCVNIGVGAWILRTKINDSGSLYNGIAWYHSATPHIGQRYRKKVLAAMKKYRQVRQPSDLLAAYPQPRKPG
ncbi:MAG: lytic transglycosylase domain-containing protein [Alphaproteobacteria bacterium]|nr:lytic transglycosylase domain-containing protein [Alphaproteobacteria bacterium]